jgi:hypothetical protein
MPDDPLRVGDVVELVEGTRLPAGWPAKPRGCGRVVMIDDEAVWITVSFGRFSRPVLLHWRALRRAPVPR